MENSKDREVQGKMIRTLEHARDVLRGAAGDSIYTCHNELLESAKYMPDMESREKSIELIENIKNCREILFNIECSISTYRTVLNKMCDIHDEIAYIAHVLRDSSEL